MTDSSDSSDKQEREFFIPDLCATKPVLIMFIVAELLVVVFVLGDSDLPEFAWGNLAMASLFVQWIVLLCAALLCAARRVLAQLSLASGVMLSFVIILLVTLGSSLVAMTILNPSAYAQLDQWWVLRNQMMAAVVGGIALRYFYLQQQLRAREQAELQARIESLRARIRPHFLFNTMNSIASLIGSRPEQAEQVVEDLSELFRASLVENSRRTTVADELHLCRLYLRIEQLRLGERLQVDWQLDEDLLDSAMPSLILQPLVENAVYHGIAQIPEGGRVCIRLSCVEGSIVVGVENPVPVSPTPVTSGHHMALDNIRQRLRALYDDDAALVVSPGAGIHTVELRMPRERLE